MHEMSLMASIFDVIKQSVEPYPDARVTKVTLVVGALTNAVPEALELAFEAFAKGSSLEGAVLEILQVPLTLQCGECQWQGAVENQFSICPECESLQVSIVAGRELLIKSLEVETDGD